MILLRYGSNLVRIDSYKQNQFLSRLINRPQRSGLLSVPNDFWIGKSILLFHMKQKIFEICFDKYQI